MFHQLPKSNIILVCDDASYKKSLFNVIKNSGRPILNELYNELDGGLTDESSQNELDFLDFQTNVLTQVPLILPKLIFIKFNFWVNFF